MGFEKNSQQTRIPMDSHLVPNALLQVRHWISPVTGWYVVQGGAILHVGQWSSLHLSIHHATRFALLKATTDWGAARPTASTRMRTPIAWSSIHQHRGRSRGTAWRCSRPRSSWILAKRCGASLCVTTPRLSRWWGSSSGILADAVTVSSTPGTTSRPAGSTSTSSAAGATLLPSATTRSHVNGEWHPLLP